MMLCLAYLPFMITCENGRVESVRSDSYGRPVATAETLIF
jgi:hypothetical protein